MPGQSDTTGVDAHSAARALEYNQPVIMRAVRAGNQAMVCHTPDWQVVIPRRSTIAAGTGPEPSAYPAADRLVHHQRFTTHLPGLPKTLVFG